MIHICYFELIPNIVKNKNEAIIDTRCVKNSSWGSLMGVIDFMNLKNQLPSKWSWVSSVATYR